MNRNTTKTRRLKIRHQTTYTYDTPVQRSTHTLHLKPIHDWKQSVLSHALTITPANDQATVTSRNAIIEFEDVFGNTGVRFEIDHPYTSLTIDAESHIELLDVDPFAFTKLPKRPVLPVAWMPWEQKMLGPYLQPMELPDTQLSELFEYASDFVRANNNDLMETLFAINLEFKKSYQYVPGSTCNETTPFQVYATKKGVCQDFAGLFIQMARLLGLPARYVCGYIYTGNINDAMADASHAWLQVYIPNVGWKGFDPTNGTLPCTDHVRLAYGRYYGDTTPTAGTLFSPANETISVSVRVEDEQAAVAETSNLALVEK